MPIDLATQKPLSATEAARHFPSARMGKPCHVSRVIRAIVSGTPTPGGRVYLDALKLGGSWVTSIEAIQDYGRQVASASVRSHSPTNTTPIIQTPSRSAHRADAALAAAGF